MPGRFRVITCGFVDRVFCDRRSTNSHEMTRNEMSEDPEFNTKILITLRSYGENQIRELPPDDLFRSSFVNCRGSINYSQLV